MYIYNDLQVDTFLRESQKQMGKIENGLMEETKNALLNLNGSQEITNKIKDSVCILWSSGKEGSGKDRQGMVKRRKAF